MFWRLWWSAGESWLVGSDYWVTAFVPQKFDFGLLFHTIFIFQLLMLGCARKLYAPISLGNAEAAREKTVVARG